MNDTFDGPFSLVQMFWGNIAARPLRCALSVIAIAIQVILVLMIVGLTSGVISAMPCSTARRWSGLSLSR